MGGDRKDVSFLWVRTFSSLVSVASNLEQVVNSASFIDFQ